MSGARAGGGRAGGGWAVVLGATSGTGEALARAVAGDPGLDVFGVHRGNHPARAEALAEAIEARGRRAVLHLGDAGTAEGARRGADALLAAAGPRSVRFFVHSLANASLGRLASGGPDQLVPRQLEKTFDAMAHSFVYWTQELLARDLLAPGARLYALTNPLHESLLRQCGAILAAKCALEAYVKHLAYELGPRGHRVNLLKFATVVTTAVEKVYPPDVLARLDELHCQMTPARRMSTPDEVAGFLALLLDPRADFLNGATIDFTGAMTQSLLDLVLNGPSAYGAPRGGGPA